MSSPDGQVSKMVRGHAGTSRSSGGRGTHHPV